MKSSQPPLWEVSPQLNAHFPTHGWATGLTGIKVLFLPIRRFFVPALFDVNEYRTARGAGSKQIDEARFVLSSPNQTLNLLAVCFRDLHTELREIEPILDPLDTSSEAYTRVFAGQHRIELLLLAAFVLLRRLADDLTRGSRPFLFRHWLSAPEQLKKLILKAEDGTLEDLDPICDCGILKDAVLKYTSWWRDLRGEGPRDRLIHKPHSLSVTPTKAGDSPWRTLAQLGWYASNGVYKGEDVLASLIRCVDDACVFMTQLCRAVGVHSSYEVCDLTSVTGGENDIVGFWPPIAEERPELPLKEGGQFLGWILGQTRKVSK